MIVKNEAKNITECLDSVRPIIDHFVIMDTGSEDNTIDLIDLWQTGHGVPGMALRAPWVDFAANRTQAIERLRACEGVDYALMMDADDRIAYGPVFDPKVFKDSLTCDRYDIEVHHGSIRHHRPQLFRNNMAFRYKGVVHEFLEVPEEAKTRGMVVGFHIQAGTSGARADNPRKYQDDAELIERALLTETDPFMLSRYRFYLAQSYRDAGEKEAALRNYVMRVGMRFWDEERYVACLEAGHLAAELDKDKPATALDLFEQATNLVPGRAEAQHAAARYCRSIGKNADGMKYAEAGMTKKQPAGLFVQPWVYEYGIIDEYAVNAYWAGCYAESLSGCLELLKLGRAPVSEWERIARNAQFAWKKINEVAQEAQEPSGLKKNRIVCWNRPGAIGDVLVTLSLVRLFKQKNPNTEIVYRAAAGIVDLLEPVMREAGVDHVETTDRASGPPSSQFYNLIGYPLHEGHPFKPMQRHLAEYFSEELGLGGERGELVLKKPLGLMTKPYVTLHAVAGWSPYKNWPLDRWAYVAACLKSNGLRVVQIGGESEPRIFGTDNYLGVPLQIGLALLANARFHMGVDSWSNHATNILWDGKSKVRGLILWGSTDWRTLGYKHNVNVSLDLYCQPCYREDPKVSAFARENKTEPCINPPGQTWEEPRHACMEGIKADYVCEILEERFLQRVGDEALA
jgi:ADP-heptose:LPS heptosyltransferase